MSKRSDSVVGNTKRIVGEVLGDGKLVEQGEDQKRDGDSKQSEKEDDASRGGPLGISDLT